MLGGPNGFEGEPGSSERWVTRNVPGVSVDDHERRLGSRSSSDVERRFARSASSSVLERARALESSDEARSSPVVASEFQDSRSASWF